MFINPTVLVLESKDEEAQAIKKIISPFFYVICFTNKEEAIAYLHNNSNQVSTAIINFENAFDLLENIRGCTSLENLPVLVTITKLKPEEEEKLYSLDVIDFLKKPFNESRVRARVKTAVKLSDAHKVINELERDELTGLFTRQAFLHRTEQCRIQNPQKNYCIIGFDFDNFKSSNTLYGEEKCNEFIAYTAKRLVAMIPQGIVGRFGGDQFIAFFEYKDQVDIAVITKIRDFFLEHAPIPHQKVKMGIYAPVDRELEMVLCCDRAFLAIREIKGIYGKDIAFYESSLQQQLLNEQRILETMERALEEDQFKIFYQPKHETITGNIAGAEALVRWIHPEYGFMQPSQFIPLFERNGFITKLDMYILTQVCTDIKRWKQNGFPMVPVSVNISRRDFLEHDCFERMIKKIDEMEIDHSLLHLEVTESLYSENTELIVSKVKKAQELGFLIEMDDFGAGYSSLGLLSSFPLDVLKLDISFVKNIENNKIVIENVIKMAHRMGFLTVAEGAESNEQFKTLKSLGCDFIQGFYFSKPLSTNDFENYIKKSSVISGRQTITSKANSSEPSPMSEALLMAANEVAEGLPGGFLSYHTDENLEIISFNSDLMKIYGCESAEEFRNFTGNSFKGLVHEEEFSTVQAEIDNQISKDNEIFYVEYRIRNKHGEIRFVRNYGRFIKTEKFGDIFYVFVNDITEEKQRKILEEEEERKKFILERAAESANKASKAKNIFIYNVARDILSPMQKIIEYTKNIESNLANKELITENLNKAKQSEEYLLCFINNVFELSKLEKDEVKLDESPTDISNAVEQVYQMVKEAAEAKNIKVEYWSELTHPYIYQDIVHTTDIVLNIVHNAVKYTPEGGTISFGMRQLPGKSPDECIIEFICEDTGIGISEEFLPHVYDNFSREDNEINREIPSAGLGLNIAKSLINLMHGTIEIKSVKGEGTSVRTSHSHRIAKENLNNNVSLLPKSILK